MTSRNHTDETLGGQVGAKGSERPDEPSAIPKDYTPDPYPGWRWNDTTGEAIVVNSLAEDEAKRAEGFTSREPVTGAAAPKDPTKPAPKEPHADPDLPPYRRPRIHPGD